MTSAVFDDTNHNQLGNDIKSCPSSSLLPIVKERRSLDEFNQFCSFILAYEAGKENSVAGKPDNAPQSPSGSSTSSATDSLTEDTRRHSLKRPSSSTQQRKKTNQADEEYDSDDESWEEVTCYCRKPFAGRPMIECSHCLTWIHLSCAKIRKSNIPKKFTCHRCRDVHLHSSIYFNVANTKEKANGKSRKKAAT